MRCQRCGNGDVCLHYSSNINGCVTETYLCSKCAAESGCDFGELFAGGNIFEDLQRIFGGIGGISGFMPMAIPVMHSNQMLPFSVYQGGGMMEQSHSCGCGSDEVVSCEPNDVRTTHEVDVKLSEQRELNIQLRLAIENEEYEKAAEIRDKIKELSVRETI